MSHVFLRLSEVKKRTGKAKTTIYREINEGKVCFAGIIINQMLL